MRKILYSVLASFLGSMGVLAQSGTNSPYSQYGLGILTDQSSGFNRGMNGLGLGFHEHNQVNHLNPASYAYLDSLTFIFDMGMSGQITRFEENGKKKNAHNADFEYAVAGFRIAPHAGFSFGIIPYTTIGYNYYTSSVVSEGQGLSYKNTYSGSGGLHQIYFGAGWEFVRGLSVGANFAYLWGDYTRSVVNNYSDGNVSTLSKYYTASVGSYKWNVGAQYTLALNKKNWLTLGVTYSQGHKIGGTPKCIVNTQNTQTGISRNDTLPRRQDGELKLEIPTILGAGLMYNYNNQLKVGVDYTLQKWAKIGYPTYQVVNNVSQYVMKDGVYKDRHQVTVGGEYCGAENGRKFFQRIHYRLGASYATPYYNVNGHVGPKEISVSAGFGIPIVNSYNNRSLLNISGQWTQMSADHLIKENTFRINIGVTFNERWFMKWKLN